MSHATPWPLAIATVAVCAVSTAHAEPMSAPKDETRTISDATNPRVRAFVRTRIGMASAPFYLADIPNVRSEISQALSFVLGGELQLDQLWTLTARFGMAPSLIALPAGSYADAKAFGNLELGVSRRLPAPDHPHRSGRPLRFRHSIRGAIALPTASHGPSMSILRNRVLAISNAIEGWHNQELFTPGVLAIAGQYTALLRRRDHRFGFALKVPLLVQVRDANLPSNANSRRVSSTPHAALSAHAEVTRWLSLGFAAHLAAGLPAPVELPGSWVQASLEPQLLFSIGQHLRLRTDVLIPVGGPLRGSAGLGIGLSGRL